MIYGITGHRPEKLELTTLSDYGLLYDFCDTIIPNDVDNVYICGMQAGFDLAFALKALQKKHNIIAAIPFDEFKPKDYYWQSLYNFIRPLAVKTIIVSPGPYVVWKLMERNKYIVDNCDELIALWNGEKSGTSHCVEYAERKRIKVTNYYEEWKEYEKERTKSNNHG